ncbi:DUF4382 domain-containing protein [Phaeocystidibacter luteus]|uniref:DUF4382 domain-containing protein n=1 Tax=Phaeocystidibacter luteus TaxID=911197 RepID=A0A6N6RFZ4_9FLAO|nr:DUF4382 domain-containing protein [Phaeocystidibacter luteus]KAB2808688.1 DUF4382 domain-containing protein [Phaeocystidibacter luteus]
MTYGKKVLLGIFALSTALVSCSEEEPTSNGTSKMNVHLTDAPCDYDEVNIDVQEVVVIYNDSMRETLTAINPGVYNILDLNNGIDTLIATEDIPSGEINQIRLVLGSNNTVMVDSIIYEMKTPSAQQSGWKIKFNEELIDGVTYDVTLDFDACKSIVLTGNGKYILKPVVRAFVDATSGAIEGYVQPDSAVTYTYVIDNNDTVGTIPDTTGYFRIQGLSAGTFDVYFDATAPYTNQTETGVNVTLGQVTDIDTIQF